MDVQKDLQKQVFQAAARQGITAVLFRNAMGRKLRINVADNECLSFLTIRHTATPTEIARYTGLSTGSTTIMLDRLERAGYVTRRPNPNDRRGVLVEVTDEWVAATRVLIADLHKAHNILLTGYSNQELATICDFLNRFTDNVQNQTTKIEKMA